MNFHFKNFLKGTLVISAKEMSYFFFFKSVKAQKNFFS